MTRLDDDDDAMLPNGIWGSSGALLDVPPTTFVEASQERIAMLDAMNAARSSPNWAVTRGNIDVVSDVGWTLLLVTPDGDDAQRASMQQRNADIIDALRPLLEARKVQAAKRYREPMFARRTESAIEFLARHGQAVGAIDPRRVPYHYLIVATPDEISFEFQCDLDAQAAVGRLLPDLDVLGRYADSAIEPVAPRRRHIEMLATNVDRSTLLSTTDLVTPLFDLFPSEGWTKHLTVESTRAQITRCFDGTATPGLTFVATHGAAYAKGDAKQDTQQGALLCQDWSHGEAMPQHLVVASDIPSATDLRGSMFVLFACFGLGTPREGQFQHLANQPYEWSSSSRVAPLAWRLIERGSLAVVGHVDRAWSASFRSEGKRDIAHFESLFLDLTEGSSVGAALEAFGQRYLGTSIELGAELRYRRSKTTDEVKERRLWTKVNDARGYAMLGDPAVRFATT